VTEGAVIAEALAKLDVPADRIVIEDKSRTTRDQAIFVTSLLKSLGVTRFILVTTPTHMPRSLAVFRAQQVDVAPSSSVLAPERLRVPAPYMPNGDDLGLSDSAAYEYAGLAYYWARGWLDPASKTTGP
jgi:uncharacterized SAM-binding protein YcdF (DUF218 family)